jgi:hypothetical protein
MNNFLEYIPVKFEFHKNNKVFFSISIFLQYLGHTYTEKIMCCLSEIQIW